MAKKTRNISSEELLDFFESFLRSENIDLTFSSIRKFVQLVNDCFNDDMMFDSWFRGIDVMN